MTDYAKLVEALRCENTGDDECGSSDCPYWSGLGCMDGQLMEDAAAAIEALQSEVQFYKVLADNWQESAERNERLLGLYRAEQAKHFYSATDNNGRIITNPCDCMNIPVFPDSSESPNS